MYIPEPRHFLGKNVSVTYRDRLGCLRIKSMHVHKVSYIAVYGQCFVGNTGNVLLDRVTDINSLD